LTNILCPPNQISGYTPSGNLKIECKDRGISWKSVGRKIRRKFQRIFDECLAIS